ncbi:MAG: hypothetical protein KAJ92_09050, partial [Gammaproteobacteria bacterium]|nr:hypothetical protein [Gammaproteobacteria bacterium]
MKQFFYFSLLTCTTFSSAIQAVDLSGNVSLQSRTFLNDPLDSNQYKQYSSFALEPELYQAWDD